MTALTDDQRGDLQADLAISNDEAVFTDAELDRLYTRAEENYAGAVVLALRQLLMNAAKFNDYTAGQTSEKKSQVFAQLKVMLDQWTAEAGGSVTQMKIVGMRSVPPREKDEPSA